MTSLAFNRCMLSSLFLFQFVHLSVVYNLVRSDGKFINLLMFDFFSRNRFRHHSLPVHSVLWLQRFRTVWHIIFLSLKRQIIRFYRIDFDFLDFLDSLSEFNCSLFSDWITIFDSTSIFIVSSFWCSKVVMFDCDFHSLFELIS